MAVACALAGFRVNLLAGPAVPNGLVGHLEMLSGGVDGVVVGDEGRLALLKKGEG